MSQLFNYVIGYVIEQIEDMCSPGPPFVGMMIFLVIMDTLISVRSQIQRYIYIPYILSLTAETLTMLLLHEFGYSFVWCTLETLFRKLTRQLVMILCTPTAVYENWENIFFSVGTTMTSVLILAFTGNIKNYIAQIWHRYKKIKEELKMLWDQLNYIRLYNREEGEDENLRLLNAAVVRAARTISGAGDAGDIEE